MRGDKRVLCVMPIRDLMDAFLDNVMLWACISLGFPVVKWVVVNRILKWSLPIEFKEPYGNLVLHIRIPNK
jgi:hypothetical protein